MSDPISFNPSGAAPGVPNPLPVSGALPPSTPALVAGKWYYVTYPVVRPKDGYRFDDTQLRECIQVRGDTCGLFNKLYRDAWGNWLDQPDWIHPTRCTLADPQPAPKRGFWDFLTQ